MRCGVKYRSNISSDEFLIQLICTFYLMQTTTFIKPTRRSFDFNFVRLISVSIRQKKTQLGFLLLLLCNQKSYAINFRKLNFFPFVEQVAVKIRWIAGRAKPANEPVNHRKEQRDSIILSTSSSHMKLV